MRRGEQAKVMTSETNDKGNLAGSMSRRTGELVVTQSKGRTADVFCRHLDDLRRTVRRYRVIHVVCDNARSLTVAGGGAGEANLAAWGHRVVLHYLPP